VDYQNAPTPVHQRSASIPSTKFHSRKFLFSHDSLPQIFPKQFHRKFFPGLSQKIFPAHAMNARFAIFQNAASHLSPGSCIHSQPHAADPEKRIEKTALPFIPA